MQCILVDRPTLGFERILKQIYAYGNIHYVEILTVYAIDQNVLHLPKPR